MTKKSQHNKQITIAFAGGGTGGHVRPIESLIQYADQQDRSKDAVGKVFWFGEKRSFEATVASRLKRELQQLKLQFVPVQSGKIRRQLCFWAWLKNLRDMALFAYGTIRTLLLLRRYKIDVVFCKGGFVAAPVVLAAKLLRKRLYTHESDTRPGLINSISARWSDVNFVGFPDVLPRAIEVGQILSDRLVGQSTVDGHQSDLFRMIEGSKKTVVFVTGGSQGSRTLYQTLADVLRENPEFQKDFVFVVTLGLLNTGEEDIFADLSQVYTVDFFSQEEMGEMYRQADIVLMRAGTTSLAEAKLFDAKLCMVPLPITHDQQQNAERYHKKYKDVILDQTSTRFVLDMEKFFADHRGYKKKMADTDRVQLVNHAKEVIWKEMLF